jgi:hypothetical protein
LLAARGNIRYLMESDSFPRFAKSPAYAAFVAKSLTRRAEELALARVADRAGDGEVEV